MIITVTASTAVEAEAIWNNMEHAAGHRVVIMLEGKVYAIA